MTFIIRTDMFNTLSKQSENFLKFATDWLTKIYINLNVRLHMTAVRVAVSLYFRLVASGALMNL